MADVFLLLLSKQF